jgi:hypothetical protein
MNAPTARVLSDLACVMPSAALRTWALLTITFCRTVIRTNGFTNSKIHLTSSTPTSSGIMIIGSLELTMMAMIFSKTVLISGPTII